jgi:hypothetical protein
MIFQSIAFLSVLGNANFQTASDKTKVINAKESGKTLDFLGYSFRYDQDLFGLPRKYWNRIPSKKSVKRFNAKVHEITSKGRRPVGEVV